MTQDKVILELLAARMTYREAAVILGMTHQGVINLVARTCRLWFTQRRLIMNRKYKETDSTSDN